MKSWQKRILSGRLSGEEGKYLRLALLLASILAIVLPHSSMGAVVCLLAALLKLELVGLGVLLVAHALHPLEPFSTLLVLVGSSVLVRFSRKGYLQQKTLANDRQEYLKTLVHELRNPLFAAKGTIDILKIRVKETSVKELEKQLTMASEAMQSINEEVDDLTQILRLESGRLLARPTTCQMKRIFSNLRRRHLPDSHPDHELVFLGEDIELVCDPLLLTQAVDKLVSNALAYSPRGSVRVEGSIVEGFAVLEVRDEGPGISKSERKWVFERHKPSTLSGGTFGIGLYLAHEYIVAQDGELRLLDSEPGCRFQIKLPLAV